MPGVLHKNVGGVQGLHVLTQAFSEKIEQEIFEFAHVYPTKEESAQHAKRHGRPITLDSYPPILFGLMNAVSDSGLFPDNCPADYCLPWSYPRGAGFAPHFDSKYRWGEVVTGISVGAESTMDFMKKEDGDNVSVRVWLPRRSIYVMSGDSRNLWEHAITKLTKLGKTPGGVGGTGFVHLQQAAEPVPEWNSEHLRRTVPPKRTTSIGSSSKWRLRGAQETRPLAMYSVDASTLQSPWAGQRELSTGAPRLLLSRSSRVSASNPASA